MAKETVTIKYASENFPFALRCNDITGIIKLHKNSKGDIRKITTRNIPITTNEKWGFHTARSGWDGKCSFITKDNRAYDYWENFMFARYKYFKQNYQVKPEEE